eukprot:gene2292-2826_t
MSKKIFDQFLLVSLHEDGANVIPYVKDVYPPDQVDPNVPLFCFPEELDKSYTHYTMPKVSDEMFTFVLTDREGKQQFGFTKRIVTPNHKTGGNTKILECLCIISHYAWSSTFSSVLDILESRYRVSVDEIHKFLSSLLLSVIPAPGDSFTVYIHENPFVVTDTSSPSSSSSSSSSSSILNNNNNNNHKLPVSYVLKRPLSTDKSSLHDGTLQPLLESLTSQKILSLFISLLFERRIIIYSVNITRVSKFVNAVVSLLDPFCWQHIFIPILPRSLLDYCTAPMPFIIGVHSSLFPLIRKKPLNEIVFVDLDKDQVLPLPEDIALFPAVLLQPLKQCLDLQVLDYKTEREDYYFKGITPPGIFEKEVVIWDLTHPVTASINNTLRNLAVQKEREKEKEKQEKLMRTQQSQQSKTVTASSLSNSGGNHSNTSLAVVNNTKTPTTLFVNNQQKQNGSSVDRSFLSSLMSATNNTIGMAMGGNNTVGGGGGGGGGGHTRSVSSVTPQSLSFLSSPNNHSSNSLSVNNNNNNNSGNSLSVNNNIKAHTVTSIDLANTPPLTNVQLPKPINNQKQQQQSATVTSTSNTSTTNYQPIPITKSASTSFTLGSNTNNHLKSNHGNNQTIDPSNNHPGIMENKGLHLNTSMAHHQHQITGDHMRKRSDSGLINLSKVVPISMAVTTVNTISNSISQIPTRLRSASTTTAPTLPTTPNTSPPTTSPPLLSNNNNPNQQQQPQQPPKPEPKPLRSIYIPIKSIPFVVIHQKFSPDDHSRISIEDIHNFLYPQQKIPTTTTTPPPQITTTTITTTTKQSPQTPRVVKPTPSSPEKQHPRTDPIMRKSASIDKNLFKIPEIPEHFAIPPLPVNRTQKNGQLTYSNSSIKTIKETEPITPLSTSASGVSTLSNNNINILPPPISPHSLIRGHQRSQSHAPNPVSNLLSTSIEDMPSLNINISNNNNINNNNSLGGSGKISATVMPTPSVNVVNQLPLNMSSQSVPKEQAFPQQQPLQSISEQFIVDNPLPPLSNSGGSSNSNFFASNPLETPIEVDSRIKDLQSSTNTNSSTSSFFSDWPLGAPSSTPQVSSNLIGQSGDAFFSAFSSSFNDFGPPAPSIPSSYHHMAATTTVTNFNTTTPPPQTLQSNPLPPLQQSNYLQTQDGQQPPQQQQNGMDEFDLYLSIRNKNQS